MRLITFSSGLAAACCACSLSSLLVLGCAGSDGADGGLGGLGGLGGSGGGSAPTDGRYEIEDVEEDCDGVEGLRAASILGATGLQFEGEFSWTDLETGYESSRSVAQVEATIADGGVITCIPFRHYPGQAPEYARLSYDAATLTVVTDDGVLNESGEATVWLFETPDPGELELEVVRAFPAAEAQGTFETSMTLPEEYENLVLVYEPSDSAPLGHVSVAREPTSDVLLNGATAIGVPHGYFPAIPE